MTFTVTQTVRRHHSLIMKQRACWQIGKESPAYQLGSIWSPALHRWAGSLSSGPPGF